MIMRPDTTTVFVVIEVCPISDKYSDQFLVSRLGGLGSLKWIADRKRGDRFEMSDGHQVVQTNSDTHRWGKGKVIVAGAFDRVGLVAMWAYSAETGIMEKFTSYNHNLAPNDECSEFAGIVHKMYLYNDPLRALESQIIDLGEALALEWAVDES